MSADLRRMAMLSLILAAVQLTACGCWDRREPETVVYPTVLAFDIDDTGMYEVLAQFPSPTTRAGGAAATQGGGAISSLPFWLNSGRGRTPFDAFKDLALTTSRQITLSHVDVILISERLARASIGAVIELISRHHEVRLTPQIAVVEGDMRSLLESEFPLEPAPGVGLLRLLELARTERSQIPDGNLLEKLKMISLPGVDPMFMRISTLSAAESQSLIDPGSTSGQIPKPVVQIHGSAVFDGDRMVGWFDGKESAGVNWLLGDIFKSLVVVDSPLGDSVVSIELRQDGCRIEPRVSGDRISIDAEVRALARVQGVTGPSLRSSVLHLEDPEVMESLTRRTSQAIKHDIEIALAKARELGVDVFGFGYLIYRKEPRAWNQIVQGRWDEIFAALEVNLDVKVTIRRPGLGMESITPR